MADIGDVDTQIPVLIVPLERNRIIEVLAVRRVDGEDVLSRQIHAVAELGQWNARVGNLARLLLGGFVKFGAGVVVCKHCLAADCGAVGAAKALLYRYTMCKMAVSAAGNLRKHLVAIVGAVQTAFLYLQQHPAQTVRPQEIALRLAHNHAGKRCVVIVQNLYHSSLRVVALLTVGIRLQAHHDGVAWHCTQHEPSWQEDVLALLLVRLRLGTGKTEFIVEGDNLRAHQSCALCKHDAVFAAPQLAVFLHLVEQSVKRLLFIGGNLCLNLQHAQSDRLLFLMLEHPHGSCFDIQSVESRFCAERLFV